MNRLVDAIKNTHPFITATGIVGVVMLGALAFAYVRIVSLTTGVEGLTEALETTNQALVEKTDVLASDIGILDKRTAGLLQNLSQAEQEIRSTQSNIANVESQVGGVAQTVGTLEKLSKTDPELLQKYSRVFFLNEHYAPERVEEIPTEYLYIEREPEVIHARVAPHLTGLLNAAHKNSVELFVRSAYRSFDEQGKLKSNYTVVYGEGTANQFSADQGYSEHQLGTAVDFITTGIDGTLRGFESTDAYRWLRNNAHRYGFTLSYPEDNSFYIFEPWHWRYVGVALATALKNEGAYFYDLDQREIDEYLVDVFE